MKGRALIEEFKAQAVKEHLIPEVAALIAEKLIKEGLVKPAGAPLPGDTGIHITPAEVRIERAEDAPRVGDEVDHDRA